MKLPFPTLDSRSVRLALTYLAIIMIMSVAFSSIFYKTSIDHLTLAGVPSAGNPGQSASTSPTADLATTGTIASINRQIQQSINENRANLLRELILLNLMALALGSVLSYYLARQALRPIEVALEAQSRFASDASHELRTPLTVIQTEIDVVLRGSNLTLERAREALRNNRREVTKLKELSEGLLRLADDGGPRSDFGLVPLGDVASEAINRVLTLAQAKRITIADAVPKSQVRGDGPSLTQVLVILLDNAIKYSPTKQTVYLEARADKKFTYLVVRDEGPGIRASDLPRIFDRFYRADVSASKRKVSGYGLGLSIAQKIVQQHGGVIAVVSELGLGATFTVKLPR